MSARRTNEQTILPLLLLACVGPSLVIAAVVKQNWRPTIPQAYDGRDDDISIAQVPHLVQLRLRGGKVICGGSLIAPQYVVTAAHCFNAYFFRQVTVVGGAGSISERGVQRQIESIDIHPDYSAADMYSDVAILKLKAPMCGPNIAPIALCDQPLRPGDVLQITGWGEAADGSPNSQKLRTEYLPAMSQAKCKYDLGHFVKEHMFCTANMGGESIHRGDSGGSAVFNGRLCGINAFTYNILGISVFTDVHSLRQYIQEALNDEHILDWDY